MNVSLTPELEVFVRQRVHSGRYSSSSEVVREGLRLLEERERLNELKLRELRKRIEEGLGSGPAEPWDKDAFLAEARARFQAERERELNRAS